MRGRTGAKAVKGQILPQIYDMEESSCSEMLKVLNR